MFNNDLPFLIFVPVLLCLLAIGILLFIRHSQLNDANILNLYQNENNYEDNDDYILDQDQDEDEEDQMDSAGEGTSTAVRIKKIGKKKGKKLQRKEQLRQYREYMDQQRELRRAQDEILEEEYKRKKAEEAIQRQDELDKIRKQQAKVAKQQEKELLAKQKEYEKSLKRKQQLYQKYHNKIKSLVKITKIFRVEELAKKIGLSIEDTADILERLCSDDSEFELSLWSDDKSTFMFVLPEDYQKLTNYMNQNDGKLIIEEVINNPISLFTC